MDSGQGTSLRVWRKMMEKRRPWEKCEDPVTRKPGEVNVLGSMGNLMENYLVVKKAYQIKSLKTALLLQIPYINML